MTTPVCKIGADGTRQWWLNDQRHRSDGPAIEDASGAKQWFWNDRIHREDGPAIIFADGTKQWWLNDKRYSFANWCKKLNKSDVEITLLLLKYGC